MNEYIFLFVLGLIWIIFAVVQDLRTREISNWLNFSLIGFVLAYRAFYSIWIKDTSFFLYGLAGVLFFVLLAYGFYYSKTFAGGDAKLLMGLGGILPYQNYFDYLTLGLGFILVLFFVGAIYTLIYSLFLIRKNKKKFTKEVKKYYKKMRIVVIASFVVGVLLLWTFVSNDFLGVYSYIAPLIIILIPWLFIYTKSIESSCMIKLRNAKDLTEGDWLERDVRISKKFIRKSVHGLSLGDNQRQTPSL